MMKFHPLPTKIWGIKQFSIETAISTWCFFYFDWDCLLVFPIKSVKEKPWTMVGRVPSISSIIYTTMYLPYIAYIGQYRGIFRVVSIFPWVWHSVSTLPGPSVFSDSTCHAREAVTRWGLKKTPAWCFVFFGGDEKLPSYIGFFL